MGKESTRFLSLDVFRGITICFMIIVNTSGSGAIPFSFLQHAQWHGFTLTDLVFPSFLFAVGNAMSFSFKKYGNEAKSVMLLKIIRRTALIFLLGYLMYWFPFFKLNAEGSFVSFPLSETRIFGVLQRIAICYCLASLLIYYVSTKKIVIISILILIIYWFVLLIFGDVSDPLSLQGNAVFFLDKYLLGENHLYHGGMGIFDPEGILSTFPAVVNVIIGYYAGKFIQEKGKGYEVIAKLMLSAGVLIFLSLCWNMAFPINKKLWTSSFVLLTTGLDLVIMASLIYIIEIKKQVKWTPFFIVFGKNSLFIYLLSELLATAISMFPITPEANLYKWVNLSFFQRIAPGPIGSLLFAASFMLICWSIGLLLDKRKIYIKV